MRDKEDVKEEDKGAKSGRARDEGDKDSSLFEPQKSNFFVWIFSR